MGRRIVAVGKKAAKGFAMIGAAAGTAAAAAGAAMLKSAMDAVESENLFEVAMGGMAKAAREWSEEIRDQLGLNAFEVRKNVATFYQMFNAMGLGEKAAYDMSTGLTRLSYDMASFFNLKPEEAFEKIRAGITGETEPLRALGILIDDTTIKQVALKKGIIEQGQEMTQQQKVLARYIALMEQTANAQGDLARTLDSPTNMLRVMRARLDEVAIKIGMALIPAFANLLKSVEETFSSINWQSEENQRVIKALKGAVIASFEAIAYALRKLVQAWESDFLKIRTVVTTYFEAMVWAANNWDRAVRAAERTVAWALNGIIGAFETAANGVIAALNSIIKGYNATVGRIRNDSIELIDSIHLVRVEIKEFSEQGGEDIEKMEEKITGATANTSLSLMALGGIGSVALEGVGGAADFAKQHLDELKTTADASTQVLSGVIDKLEEISSRYGVRFTGEISAEQLGTAGDYNVFGSSEGTYYTLGTALVRSIGGGIYGVTEGGDLVTAYPESWISGGFNPETGEWDTEYQHGGVAWTPQVARLAEREPELVVPFSKLERVFGRGGITINGNIIIQANSYREGMEAARGFMKVLDELGLSKGAIKARGLFRY